ncbi:MAG: dihydrodipicolinate synthase family protein, partial [Sedimentisphaerales bacterium]
MGQNKRKLSGVFAPVVTPFRSDELALDDLRFNLRKLSKTDLTGYFALGSNGEFRSLTDKEQIQVLNVFAEEKGNKVVMVGTGCESTRQTIEKSKLASEMGFDYVSILTPGYFAKRIDGDTLQCYYERIADSIEIPVLLYNAPGFAGGVEIPPQTVLELSQHPNIAGMKDSSPTGPGKFLARLEPDADFHVLAGSANFFYPALHLGAA